MRIAKRVGVLVGVAFLVLLVVCMSIVATSYVVLAWLTHSLPF